MDIVVTVPKNFRFGDKRGLAAWLDEGDAPGSDWEDDGENYHVYTTHGPKPDIKPGERVYVVCEGRLVGYAPLAAMEFTNKSGTSRQWGMIELIRAGGAVACTLRGPVVGFRGWRKRWWNYEDEIPLDLSPWMTIAPKEVSPLFPDEEPTT